MEDIELEILNAIKQDNVELFSKSIGDNYNLCYGRFPILTLLYLYNSVKIIKKYESTLIKQKQYKYLDENIEMYSKFRQVAGRSLRLYIGENKVVSPLEMLLILGKATKVEKLYKDAAKSNLIQENLKTIESIKSSQDIEIGETKIKLPKQKITKASKKIVMLVACVAILMIALSGLSAFMFVHFGIGTDKNPYNVSNAQQLLKALSYSSSSIVLDDDITLESLDIDSFDGKINGNGHELTVQNVSKRMIGKLTGRIENLTINIKDVDITTNIGIGLFVDENKGELANITFNISGKVTYNGTATTESVFISTIAQKNYQLIDEIVVNLDFEVVGNGTSDVIFGTIAGHNEGSIKNGTLNGTLNMIDVNGAGVTYENTANIENTESNLKITQSSDQYGINILIGGITVLNTGSLHKCINLGKIETTDMAEKGVYVYAGGVVAINYARIDVCKFAGEIKVTTKYTLVRAGGICALSEFINQTMEPSLDECASSGKIDISFENTSSIGYVGGIIGEVSSYTGIEKSFTITEITSTESENILMICGICGLWSGSYTFDSNAYLAVAPAQHGIGARNIFGEYIYLDDVAGLFNAYNTIDEIKALEIYW